MKSKIGLLVLSVSLSLMAVQAMADEEVCYVPVRGEGLTAHVPEYDATGNLISEHDKMMGRYSLVLKKTTAGPGRKTLRLAGPMQGAMNPDGTLHHILGVDAAEGLIYSFYDIPVEYTQIDICQAHAKEIINFGLGTGIFAGAYGSITAIVDVDYCANMNEFVIVPKEGYVCFDVGTADE